MSTPNTVETIFRLTKEGTGAPEAAADIKSVGKAAEESNFSLSHLKEGMEKLLAAFAIERVLDLAIEEFKAVEQAVAKLDGSLRSTGQYSAEYSQHLQSLAKELSEVSLAEKAAILNTQALLISFGAPRESIQLLTEKVLDLSALFGGDLNRATMVISAALQGQFTPAMRELRFQFDENKTATENFADLLDRIEKVAGGQAKASISTLSGELEQHKKHWKELTEIIGEKLVGGINTALTGIEKLSAAVDKSFNSTNPLWYLLMDPAGIAAQTAALTLARNLPPSSAGAPGYASGSRNSIGPGGGASAASAAADFATMMSTIHGASQPSLPLLLDSLGAATAGAAKTGGATIHISDPEKVKASLLELNKLREQYSLAGLEGTEKESAALLLKDAQERDRILKLAHLAEISDEEKMQRLGELDDATLAGFALIDAKQQEIIDKQTEADEKRVEKIRDTQFNIKQANDMGEQLKGDLIDIAKQGEQAFSQGLASAIVDAFEQGDKAFQQFASNFLKQIANMILQSLILRAIQGVFGGLSGGGQVTKAASGYMGMVDQPTYLSRFNVLAGEAGPEQLTVLAGPKLFAMGGVTGTVGNVNGQRMAVVNADQLAAQRGGGGGIAIEVTLSPGLEARITQNSIKGAEIRVAQAMTQDTPVSRATRKLVS